MGVIIVSAGGMDGAGRKVAYALRLAELGDLENVLLGSNGELFATNSEINRGQIVDVGAVGVWLDLGQEWENARGLGGNGRGA